MKKVKIKVVEIWEGELSKSDYRWSEKITITKLISRIVDGQELMGESVSPGLGVLRPARNLVKVSNYL